MSDVLDTHRVSVHTPIEEFVHPDSGSVIEVVSTMHVGSPQYYDDLHDHLQLRADEGFLVGEEAIREPTIAEIRDASVADRDKLSFFKIGVGYAMQALVGVENSPSFTHQYELDARLAADPHIPELINMDVSAMDIARNAGHVDLARIVFSAFKLSKELERAFKRGPEEYDQAIYDAIAKQHESSKSKHLTHPKRRDRVMVHDRNAVVLARVDSLINEDPITRVALVWGYGHRRGLVDGIKQRGYRPTRVLAKTVAVNPALLR